MDRKGVVSMLWEWYGIDDGIDGVCAYVCMCALSYLNIGNLVKNSPLPSAKFLLVISLVNSSQCSISPNLRGSRMKFCSALMATSVIETGGLSSGKCLSHLSWKTFLCALKYMYIKISSVMNSVKQTDHMKESSHTCVCMCVCMLRIDG